MNQETQKLWPGWETGKVLGRGGFSTVYEIRRDTFGEEETAALKVITIPQDTRDIDELRNDGYDDQSITERFRSFLESIVKEYSLMAKLKGHPNVVYCDDLRYIQHDDGIGWDIYIKMELLSPLPKSLPQQIPEAMVVKLGMDICAALALCRSQKVIHRDLKPQNIFVGKDGSFKLGDFGIAKTTEKTTSGTKVGTYKYMAPEVYKGLPYGHRADLYSLGLVLYWMLNHRRTPFLPLPPKTPGVAAEDEAMLRRLKGEPLPPPAEGSPALKRIVLKACAFDPAQRYATAEEMLRDLKALSGTEPEAEAVPMGNAFRERGEEAHTQGVFRDRTRKEPAVEHTEGVFYGWEERERLRQEEARRQAAEQQRQREQARLAAEAEQRRRKREQYRRQQEEAEKYRLEQEAIAKRKKQQMKKKALGLVTLVAALVIIFGVTTWLRNRAEEELAYTPPAAQSLQPQYEEPIRRTDGEEGMSYEDYLAAPLDSRVVLQTYAQAALELEDGKTCVYCQDEEGAYYLYNVECSQDLLFDLYPGAPIRVEGLKGEWAGCMDVYNAVVTPLSGEGYSAQASDITSFWGGGSLSRLQNRLVSLRGATVTGIFFDNSQESWERDIGIGLKLDGQLGNAQVLRRLVGPDSELHQLAMTLKPGDQIDLVGYLNWYEGPDIHVVWLEIRD